MKIIVYISVYFISYIFGSFTFPQIVGSIRMISRGNKTPYAFTLVLWSVIFTAVSFVVYLCLANYFATYLVGLIIPLMLTVRTKNIE